MSLGGGHMVWAMYEPTKTTHIGEISNFEFTKLQISTSLARRDTLFEPIMQYVPQIHCNLSSFETTSELFQRLRKLSQFQTWLRVK